MHTSLDNTRPFSIIQNRKRAIAILIYFFYFISVNFLLTNNNGKAIIDFPGILILVMPYVLFSIINPTSSLAFFIIYILSGLKDVTPAYATFLSLSILLEMCLVVSFCFHILISKRFPNLKDLQSVLWFLFIGITMVSAFFSGSLFHKEGGGILKVLILRIVIYMLLIYFINSFYKLALFFRAIVFLGLVWFVTSIIHIIRYGLDQIILREYVESGYLEAILDVNYLAASILMFMPIVFFQMMHDKSVFWRRLSFICFLFMIVNTILTFSRNGFITLVIVISLLFYKGKKFLDPLIIILILIVLIFIIPSSYWNRMSTISSLNEQRGLGGKLVQFQLGIDIILKHPVNGIGYGKTGTIHNTFLQIASDLGLPTLFLFLSILIIALKNLRKIEQHLVKNKFYSFSKLPWFLSTSLIAYMVSSLTISIHLFYPFLIILAVIVALKRVSLKISGVAE